MKVFAAAAAIQNARPYQEDAHRLILPKGSARRVIAIVADGMGGGGHGDVASAIIADTVAERLTAAPATPDTLRSAADAANQAIAAQKAADPALKGMGATLIAAVIEDGTLTFCAVGDSLLYRIRDGELHALNEKHKAAIQADLAALSGTTRWADAMGLRARESAINSAIAGVRIPHMQAAARPVLPGDLYIIASDGVAAIDPDLLRRVVEAGAAKSLSTTAAKVLEAVEQTSALGDGNGDNATIILLRCEGAAKETVVATQISPRDTAAPERPSKTPLVIALLLGALVGAGAAFGIGALLPF
ncbi:MAG: protein phosphatase 2C domain-containing protein [Pseudomonadota bacterium]